MLCPTPEMRDRCVELAPAHGIEVRTMHDPALHTHPAFAGCRAPAAARDRGGRRARARLPMANTLGDDAIDRIAGLVHAARVTTSRKAVTC